MRGLTERERELLLDCAEPFDPAPGEMMSPVENKILERLERRGLVVEVEVDDPEAPDEWVCVGSETTTLGREVLRLDAMARGLKW